MKKSFLIGFVFGLFLFVVYYMTTLFSNLGSEVTGSKVVTIPPHSTLKTIAQILGEEEVIESPRKFYLITRLAGKGRNLKPGEYLFDVPTPPWSALQTLLSGKVILYKVTFPEGINMNEVTVILAEAGLVDADQFSALLKRTDLLEKHKIPGHTFEGFLFPDTYFFSRLDPPEKILSTMVKRFRQALTESDQIQAKRLGFDLLEWVTFASILEKESGLTSEHETISSVFHNRLRKGMRLQSDPTVIYGIPNFDGNLTRKHLETSTPYNTYRKSGLPPGPIANPGASALRAAVNPATTNYLYFVADRKGAHVFSKTLGEHNRAVAKYQLRRRASR